MEEMNYVRGVRVRSFCCCCIVSCFVPHLRRSDSCDVCAPDQIDHHRSGGQWQCNCKIATFQRNDHKMLAINERLFPVIIFQIKILNEFFFSLSLLLVRFSLSRVVVVGRSFARLVRISLSFSFLPLLLCIFISFLLSVGAGRSSFSLIKFLRMNLI